MVLRKKPPNKIRGIYIFRKENELHRYYYKEKPWFDFSPIMS